LIEEAFSKEQLSTIRTRVVEQAAGERLAGVGFHYAGGAGTGKTTHATQFVTSLANKGDCFRGFMEHDPAVVQAGPLIEQLLNETVGPDFIITSFISIIASRGGHPQSLHQDSGELQTEAPLLCNHLVFLDDVNYFNGGTMIVPRSHKILYQSGNHRPVKQLPPAISLEAKAGTLMMMDGHTLHGTGINQTEKPRHILVMACIKPWMRTQELFPFSLEPEVLANASLKLLQRLCFVGNGIGGIEGHGQEPGVLRGMRQAMDAGNYVRIGELSPSSSKEELTQDYTWRSTTTGRRAAINQPERQYPPEKLWESNDPVEQTPVDERHKVLQEATLINRRKSCQEN
jgi:ectoine hydroxylase-related dioxygenase (phytanoyl-CoA dioxygenase family)